MQERIESILAVAVVAAAITFAYACGHATQPEVEVVTYHETYTCDPDGLVDVRKDQTAAFTGYSTALLKHCVKNIEKGGV